MRASRPLPCICHLHAKQTGQMVSRLTFIFASAHAAEAMARALVAFSAAVLPATNGSLAQPAPQRTSLLGSRSKLWTAQGAAGITKGRPGWEDVETKPLPRKQGTCK